MPLFSCILSQILRETSIAWFSSWFGLHLIICFFIAPAGVVHASSTWVYLLWTQVSFEVSVDLLRNSVSFVKKSRSKGHSMWSNIIFDPQSSWSRCMSTIKEETLHFSPPFLAQAWILFKSSLNFQNIALWISFLLGWFPWQSDGFLQRDFLYFPLTPKSESLELIIQADSR